MESTATPASPGPSNQPPQPPTTTVTASGKHHEMQAKFLQQQAARLQSRRDTKAKGEAGRDPKESVGLFWTELRRAHEDVTRAVDGLLLSAAAPEASSAAKDQVEETLTRTGAKIQALDKHITDAALFLPPYDVRRAQEEAAGLRTKLEEARVALAPRKKFSFGARRRNPPTTTAPTSAVAPADASAPPPAPLPPPITAVPLPAEPEHANKEGFSAATDATLSLAALGPAPPQDLLLRDLTRCTVHLLAPLHFLRMEGLQDCKVLVGPVAGPVYVERCDGCTFYMASRQLRIHHTTASTLYVHTVSGPIIEDCHTLRFAPLALTYPGMESHLAQAQIAGTKNTWNEVKDFKWLRAQQSPNWAALPEEERVTETVEEVEAAAKEEEEGATAKHEKRNDHDDEDEL